MDSARRDQLAARRQLAQLRLARGRASATYRALSPLLCQQGARFARLPPVACDAALQGLTDGPGQDERLLWGDVPGARCRPWADAADRNALIAAALAEVAAPATRIAVIWEPTSAGLLIRHQQLRPVIGALFDQLHGTIWLVAANGGPWLIEVSLMDDEICWAPVMPGCN